jgi:Ser/Thr protein kinase RdoA (MazF antagonist)
MAEPPNSSAAPGGAEAFPPLRTILDAGALGRLVAERYGLRDVRCQLIKSVILDTYLVRSASGPTILRVYPARRRTRAAIEAELAILDRLQAGGVAVSVGVPAADGERLLALAAPEGERLAGLFSYAPGAPLEPARQLGAVRALGEQIARLHAVGDTLPPALLEARPALVEAALLDRPLAALDATFPERAADWAALRALAETVRVRLAALPREQPFYGLCHGDLAAGNVHVQADGQLTLFDLDFCGPSWRAYDVAVFLIGEPEDVAAAFRAGYAGLRPLEETERAALPLLAIAQQIWLLGTRADYVNEFGRTHFGDRFVGRVLAGIRGYAEQGGIAGKLGALPK